MNRLLAHKDQLLVSHLNGVAQMAESFAATFDAAEQGRLAGVLHDLGKAEEEFQKRIHTAEQEGEKQPHAHHGAGYALRSCAVPQWPIALAINGHHAGLHNRGDVDQKADQYQESAKACLEKIRASHPEFSIPMPQDMLPIWLSGLEFFPGNKGDGWLATELFTRFLYSALVDADRLDAEQNDEDGEKKKRGRRWEPFSPELLLSRLEKELANRTEKAKDEGKASAQVMAVRQAVGRYCRDSADKDRGLFSLTVPTGGGKTLASMLFALHHAIHHNKSVPENKRFRRIIVVIPYLSIIQQTAKEFRDIFEPGEVQGRIVLEHHSQVEDEPEATGKKKDKKEDEPSYDSISERRRLAAENWDAPIIVTTSVQFFESLFSRRPAKARKLHNIAQSIIIFDEIQTLPPLMLQPILHVLSELAHPQRHYGCSMIFCTATQPALDKSENLPTGLENVRHIVPVEKAREHFSLLRRVIYSWPEENESITWDELAESVLRRDVQQSLIVVNTRKAARELYKAFRDRLGDGADGLFHLSTWMIPAHRLEVLNEARRRLDPKNYAANGRERCILVSTQCIEAGVDVDFPAVWRAFGPYDSIVQVAGRCNRNGLIGNPEEAVVRIFHPQDSGSAPKGLYTTAIAQTELLRKMGLAVPDDPDSFTTYFRLLYQLSVPDECGVQRARSRLQFKEVDELFEFIEQNTISVLIQKQDGVPTEGGKLYAEAQTRQPGKGKIRGYFTREDWRNIQPYIINLPSHMLKNEAVTGKLLKAFNDEASGLYVWNGAYYGGLQGTGIDFEGPIPAEEFIL